MNIVSLWGGGVGLPETVGLAAVAVIGYLFGRRRPDGPAKARPSDEVLRAAEIASQLQGVAASLRGDLAAHLEGVERFKRVVERADGPPTDADWSSLRGEAERVLEPTLRLVAQVADAYDQIRRQSQALAGFSGGRTDPLTGLCNSRGLSELLQIELAGHAAVGGEFSMAIVGLHPPVGGPSESRAEQQARILQATELIRNKLRDTDRLARYGIDELVVVMPNTRLYGASVFGRRSRTLLSEAGLTVSIGLAQSMPADDAPSLLGRADSALYSAKASAPDGALYLHNGAAIRADAPRGLAAAVADAPADVADPGAVAATPGGDPVATAR